jgi:hypothetical protein
VRTFSYLITSAASPAPTRSFIFAESEQRALELARRDLTNVCDVSLAELREGGKLLWIETVQPDACPPLASEPLAHRQRAISLAHILLAIASMFEIEKLRLVEMRLRARGRRTLLTRIDRALQQLTLAGLSEDGDQLEAVKGEIDALAAEVDHLE